MMLRGIIRRSVMGFGANLAEARLKSVKIAVGKVGFCQSLFAQIRMQHNLADANLVTSTIIGANEDHNLAVKVDPKSAGVGDTTPKKKTRKRRKWKPTDPGYDAAKDTKRIKKAEESQASKHQFSKADASDLDVWTRTRIAKLCNAIGKISAKVNKSGDKSETTTDSPGSKGNAFKDLQKAIKLSKELNAKLYSGDTKNDVSLNKARDRLKIYRMVVYGIVNNLRRRACGDALESMKSMFWLPKVWSPSDPGYDPKKAKGIWDPSDPAYNPLKARKWKKTQAGVGTTADIDKKDTKSAQSEAKIVAKVENGEVPK